MLTEQRPQPNIHDPECAADSLLLCILQTTRLNGCQFGTGKYDELSINSINNVTVPIKIK